MAAESDVRKMPTVVITGPPRSIAKKGPLQKKEAFNIFDHKSNKSFGLFI